jgi:hypothetical protein
MSQLKDLLEIAKAELIDLSPLDEPHFRLEQAVLSKDSSTWEIVVSYLIPNTNEAPKNLSVLAPEFAHYRVYKRVVIDDKKHVIGLYIYRPEP